MRSIYAHHLTGDICRACQEGLDLDRIKLEAIPDILRKYTDPLLIKPFSWIDLFI